VACCWQYVFLHPINPHTLLPYIRPAVHLATSTRKGLLRISPPGLKLDCLKRYILPPSLPRDLTVHTLPLRTLPLPRILGFPDRNTIVLSNPISPASAQRRKALSPSQVQLQLRRTLHLGHSLNLFVSQSARRHTSLPALYIRARLLSFLPSIEHLLTIDPSPFDAFMILRETTLANMGRGAYDTTGVPKPQPPKPR